VQRVDTVLVKLASRCNLACSYCYVYEMGDAGWRHQPKVMSPSTVSLLAGQMASLAARQEHGFELVFHGGEPLLVGPDRFAAICDELRAALPPKVSLGLQTNGVLLSDKVVGACVTNGVTVSVSVDGTAAAHDRHRPDKRGRGSHAAVTAGIERLRRHPGGEALFTGVLAVIDLLSRPVETYEALKALRPGGMDFLYRDGNHDALPPGKRGPHTTEYGAWLTELLDHYLADPDPVPVRVLDEMLRMLIAHGRAAPERRVRETGLLVVETDGTLAKNDTLKVAQDGADRFDRPFSLHTDDVWAVVGSPEFTDYVSAQPPRCGTCLSCPDYGPCGGGMPCHRWGGGRGFDNPSVFCADQRRLVAAMRGHLSRFGIVA